MKLTRTRPRTHSKELVKKPCPPCMGSGDILKPGGIVKTCKKCGGTGYRMVSLAKKGAKGNGNAITI